jgi:hypothetical protein
MDLDLGLVVELLAFGFPLGGIALAQLDGLCFEASLLIRWIIQITEYQWYLH